MADFVAQMQNTADLTVGEQKKLGEAPKGDMDPGHKEFVKQLTKLIDSGEINPDKPDTFLKQSVYATIDTELKTKVDMALPNLATLITHIVGFFKSKQTPDSSPQLQSMIDQLWEMKERVEQYADVYKF